MIYKPVNDPKNATTRKPARRAGVLVAAVALMAAASSCGSDAASSTGPSNTDGPVQKSASASDSKATVDKSGGSSDKPLTIVVGTENEASGAENEVLAEFRDQVAALSDGSMEVQIAYDLEQVADPPLPLTARAVEEGKVDMALTGATAWGTDGVTSLQALQAPFVVRSHDQAMALLHDDALVADLLGGLDAAGVVGISLFPEDFRMLVDFDRPITKVTDLAGRTVRTRLSAEVGRFYESLGMTVLPWSNATDVREFSPDRQGSLNQGTAVGNLPVYFRFATLVANSDFWNGLDDEQQAVVREAATNAQAFAEESRTKERSLSDIAAYCSGVGSVNWLDESAITGFEEAAQPTLDLMATDPTTAEALDTIAAMATADPDVYPVCGSVDPTASSEFPEGVYRYEVTMDDLRKIDVQQAVEDNVGVYTYTLADGAFTWTQQPASDTATPVSGEGTYTVNGDQLTMIEPGGPDLKMTPTVLQWTVAGDGNLEFQIIDSPWIYVKWVYGEPWIRIGDAP